MAEEIVATRTSVVVVVVAAADQRHRVAKEEAVEKEGQMTELKEAVKGLESLSVNKPVEKL